MILFLRKYLRETLKMANSEDLNRLTACSLVLLGNTFLSQGVTQVQYCTIGNGILTVNHQTWLTVFMMIVPIMG